MNRPDPDRHSPGGSASAPSLDGIAAVIDPHSPPVIASVIASVIAAGQPDDPHIASEEGVRKQTPEPRPHTSARLPTAGGAWQVGTDPNTGMCVAIYRTGPDR